VHPLNRPTRYPQRRTDPQAADLSMEFQRPPAEPMPSPGQGTAPAFPGSPEGAEARPGQERDRLLSRITGASVPSRTLCLLLLEVEGLGCFTDDAFRRMAAILDLIENTQERTE
jgi:hypothetical protein